MSQPTSVRPNVILIFTDQLRADALGCYGSTIVSTPNIDRMAQSGVLFEDCMITQPTCTPSRASILTGCYPSAIRSRMVGCATPDDPRFLPRLLKTAGYHTASIGKIHLVPQGEEQRRIDESIYDGELDYFGFSEIELVNGHGAGCMGSEYINELSDAVPDWRERYEAREFYADGIAGAKAGTHKYPYPAEFASSSYVADRAIEFLNREHDSPFFLHLSFNDPHHPFTVPEPWASMYPPEKMPLPTERSAPDTMPPWYKKIFDGDGSDRVVDGTYNDPITGTVPMKYSDLKPADWQQVKAIYYGMISHLDHHLGRVLDALESTGQTEQTILVFVTDHGEYLGDHGFVGKGYHFEPVIKTPLIYNGPGIQSGECASGIASTVDIAPTILDLCGVDEPVGVHGISQADLLEVGGVSKRNTAITENDDDLAGEKMRTLTRSDWKLTYYTGREYGELYDRTNDPEERNNLWFLPEHREIRNELERELLEEVLCTLDILPVRHQKPVPIPKKWIPRANQSQGKL